jgi:hypothetical protein
VIARHALFGLRAVCAREHAKRILGGEQFVVW